MQLSDFDYDLPPQFIAQTPAHPRDSAKLMVLNRTTQTIRHHVFRDIIDMLHTGDVLVTNTTRVIPARIPARKASGGAAEILLLRQLTPTRWQALIGGRKITQGSTLTLPNSDLTATIAAELDGAEREIEFSEPLTDARLREIGEMPLPPYIHTRLTDAERYQTIYSQQTGSAAAPTAGLHFTPELLLALREKGVKLAHCVLHIGLDTFAPVKEDLIENHKIHSERAMLSPEDAKIINEAKLAGGRVIAVGTTSARTLETAAILSAGADPAHPNEAESCGWRPVIAYERDTNLFIYPGYRWRVVDAMITNFHLPKSTLLMMMSSFAGRDFLLHAYETAKQNDYRFFSFGDAMFIES